MSAPKHTPYDGSAHPFGIGLRPLDLKNWIEVDEHLPRYLSEKHRLMQEIPGRVWAGDFSGEKSQEEVLKLLVAHLLEQYPDTYTQNETIVSVAGFGDVDLDEISRPPLLTAAYLVQEDLVLLRKSPEGWRIVAASVCFPSSWVLREKIGKVMHHVHGPVPGYQKGTRNALMIERIFDNLLVDQPVERFNWSVYNDDALYHDDRAGEHFPDHAEGEAEHFLRVEHQTLRKLPVSGDILFTIRIHIDPIDVLSRRADCKVLGRQFIETIGTMDHDQQAYKGLDRGREQLIERIREVTGQS